MANVQQAPNMFQGQNPDLYTQQMQLQRQQQMADMLRQQSATPIDTQYVTGSGPARAVPITAMQSIAKLLQGGVGAYMQNKGDEKQAQLGAEISKRKIDALRSLAPAGVFGDQGADAVMSDAPQASSPEAQIDPATKQAWIRALNVANQNPEIGSKLIENLSTLTNDQKNWSAQGLNPRDVGAAEMGKLRAAGLVNVAPNNTVLEASTNKPVFAGADFSKGVQNTFGPDGAPQISRMQGSDIIPQMAGETERAKAGGTAAYEMVKLDTPSGPVMVTKEQAAQMAGGGAPSAAPVHFTATNGVQLNFDKSTPQQVIDGAFKSGDPKVMEAAKEWINSGSKATGIPLQSDVDKERQLGEVRVKNAVDESLAKQLPQEQRDKQIAIAKGQSAISLIDKALSHPGMKTATGLQGTIDPRNYIPGTNAKDFQIVMDQLGGQTFLQAMESLRGTGQITEIEGKKASDAIARLNRSQSTDEFQKALSDFKEVASAGVKRIQGNQFSIDAARDKLNGSKPVAPVIPTIAPIQQQPDISGFKVIR